MGVRFLTLETVIEIHCYQIEHYGGLQAIRDVHLLQSALAAPAATFGGKYLHESLEEMAAVYLFHLVMNHPFVDGNKRVGAAAAAIFLEMNGKRLTTTPDDYAELVLSVASGATAKPEIVEFFQAHSEPC